MRHRHVQRSAVFADVVARDLDAALREFLVSQPVQDVQLTDRRAAQAVDHQGDAFAAGEGQVGDDGVEQLRDDLRGGGDVDALAAGLTVDADTHLGLLDAELEDRGALGGRRARRQGHAHAAGHRVDVLPDAHDLVEVGSPLRGRAHGLDDEEVARDTAPAHGERRVVDGHVVIDQDGADLDALGLGQFLRHLERHPVARVVVHDVRHARVGGELAGRAHDVLHRRRGEHIARAGAVEHSGSDRHDVRRFVTRTRTLQDRHLVRDRGVRTRDQVDLGVVGQGVRIGEGETLEHLGHEILGVVDELLHASSSDGDVDCDAGVVGPLSLCAISSVMTAMATAPGSALPTLRAPV